MKGMEREGAEGTKQAWREGEGRWGDVLERMIFVGRIFFVHLYGIISLLKWLSIIDNFIII